MKLLINGTNQEESRNFYFSEKNKLTDPIFLNGDSLQFNEFFQAAEGKSLFDTKICIVIENLLSKNKSTSLELKKIVEYINASKNLEILLWESTELSKSSLSLIKNIDTQTFSYPKKLFVFLDQLKPGNSTNLIKLFHELREFQEAEIILFMLIRQFRLFLGKSYAFSENIEEINRMAPWQASKISAQSRYFDKNKLVSAYNSLFEIETNQKTGRNPYALDVSIDFFLTRL